MPCPCGSVLTAKCSLFGSPWASLYGLITGDSSVFSAPVDRSKASHVPRCPIRPCAQRARWSNAETWARNHGSVGGLAIVARIRDTENGHHPGWRELHCYRARLNDMLGGIHGNRLDRLRRVRASAVWMRRGGTQASRTLIDSSLTGCFAHGRSKILPESADQSSRLE